MSKTLNVFITGAAIGFALGSKNREQTLARARSAAESTWGFALDRIADVRETRELRRDERDFFYEPVYEPDAYNPATYNPGSDSTSATSPQKSLHQPIDESVDDLDEVVDRMSDDSFPSSDPPSTYAGPDRLHLTRP